MAKTALRYDLAAIAGRIAADHPNGEVLDVGCGDGTLLAALRADCGAIVRGIEIEPDLVAQCVAKGLSVIQGDANSDLAEYPDNSFDFVVLSRTLQTTDRPDKVLEELLRVGQRAFVSFPNFAHWRTRSALLLGGRMPVTRALPVSWYETRNIHHVTVEDFRALVAQKGARIERRWFFSGGKEIGTPGANWRAEIALFEIAR